MRMLRLVAVPLLVVLAIAVRGAMLFGETPAGETVSIDVDTSKTIGPMTPIWAWFGYDEPNYTYTANGTEAALGAGGGEPRAGVLRTHNLLTTGDGPPALKWGSTNAYTEDANGRPRTTGRSSIASSIRTCSAR